MFIFLAWIFLAVLVNTVLSQNEEMTKEKAERILNSFILKTHSKSRDPNTNQYWISKVHNLSPGSLKDALKYSWTHPIANKRLLEQVIKIPQLVSKGNLDLPEFTEIVDNGLRPTLRETPHQMRRISQRQKLLALFITANMDKLPHFNSAEELNCLKRLISPALNYVVHVKSLDFLIQFLSKPNVINNANFFEIIYETIGAYFDPRENPQYINDLVSKLMMMSQLIQDPDELNLFVGALERNFMYRTYDAILYGEFMHRSSDLLDLLQTVLESKHMKPYWSPYFLRFALAYLLSDPNSASNRIGLIVEDNEFYDKLLTTNNRLVNNAQIESYVQTDAPFREWLAAANLDIGEGEFYVAMKYHLGKLFKSYSGNYLEEGLIKERMIAYCRESPWLFSDFKMGIQQPHGSSVRRTTRPYLHWTQRIPH